jgi:DNA (cytosine-5)-methyltransferase 1
MTSGSKWPTAAYGSNGDAWAVDVSLWPRQMPYRHLADVVDLDDAPPLSARATAGFLNRAERSTLHFADGFLADMAQHADLMSGERAVA